MGQFRFPMDQYFPIVNFNPLENQNIREVKYIVGEAQGGAKQNWFSLSTLLPSANLSTYLTILREIGADWVLDAVEIRQVSSADEDIYKQVLALLSKWQVSPQSHDFTFRFALRN